MTELELNELEVGDFVISPMGGVLEVKSVTTKTPKYGAHFKEVRFRFVSAAMTAKNPLVSRYQSCKALKVRAMAAADWINEHTEYRVKDASDECPLARVGFWFDSNGGARNAFDVIEWAESLGYGSEVDASA